MRDAFIAALVEAAEQDPSVWLLSGDLGFNVIDPFRDRFPDRFVNMGVAEQNMAGVAAGMAMMGKRPFIYSIANFPTLRCLEQIRNDICYHNCTVCIVAVGGGLAYGAQGYTHHGLEDLAIMRALPGMTVIAPGDPLETTWATNAAAKLPGPSYLRLGRGGEPIVHSSPPDTSTFRLGEAIVVREGADAAILSTGAVLADVMEAAESLAQTGRSISVVSFPTIRPFDHEAVLAAAQCGKLLTIEEHGPVGGLGSLVAETLGQAGTVCQLERLAVPEQDWGPVGSQKWMREQALGNIASALEELLNR